MKYDVNIYLLIISVAFIFAGCTIQGLYSGYNNLSQEEKKKVIDLPFQADISDLTTSGSIYLITPENLKSAVQAHNRNVIYLWNPLCSNTTCVSPAVAKTEAEKSGHKLWLVSTHFFNDMTNLDFGIPIYGIKESVERKTTSKYLKSFVKEMGCENYDFELFIVFNEGSYRYLNDISHLPALK